VGGQEPRARCTRATGLPLFQLLRPPRGGTAYAKPELVRGFSYPPGPTLMLAIALVSSACASIGGDGGEGAGAPDAGQGGGDDVGGSDGGSGVSQLVEVEVSGLAAWTDTGVDLRVGEHVAVTASGLVSHGGGGEHGPAGDPALTSFAANVVNCVGHVALIGRLGDTGDAFYLGPDTSFAATSAARLFLGVNDTGVDNNAGSFAAEVATGLRYAGVASQTIDVSGTTAWTDTGIDLAAGQQLTITASGTVIHATGTNDGCDPGGEPATSGHGANVVGCPNHAALIGKIGDAGAPFLVGRTYSVPAGAAGRLYLGINDNDLGNNGGAYAAEVSVTER
jgi:hypothetical protein